MGKVLLFFALMVSLSFTVSCGGNSKGGGQDRADTAVDSVTKADSATIASLTQKIDSQETALKELREGIKPVIDQDLASFKENLDGLKNVADAGYPDTSTPWYDATSAVSESENACKSMLKMMNDEQRAKYDRLSKQFESLMKKGGGN